MLRSRTPRQPVPTGSSPFYESLRLTRTGQSHMAGDKLQHVKTRTNHRRQIISRRKVLFISLTTVLGLVFAYSLLAFMFTKAHSQSKSTVPSPTKNLLEGEDQWVEPVSTSTWIEDPLPPVRIPKVDRAVLLEILGRPRIHEMDEDDDDGRHPHVKGRLRWPPMVTALPESRPIVHGKTKFASKQPTLTTEQVDTQFCGRSPCRVLLPLLITEREPKIQRHLTQLLVIAKELNRTLVLPNVGHGRAGTCLRWDFSLYFDIASVVRLGNAPVMLMDDFRTWVDMRPQKPAGRIMAVDEKPTSRPSENTEYSSGGDLLAKLETVGGIEAEPLKSARCLNSRFPRLDLDSISATTIHLISTEEQRQLDSGSVLHNLLLDCLALDGVIDPLPIADNSSTYAESQATFTQPEENSRSDADVLLLYWDVHQQVFAAAPPQASIDYSSKLWELSAKLTTPITPYLAVHWYMGKVPPDDLPACADALVDALDTLLHDETLARGIETVWLSTDYSRPVSSKRDPIGYVPGSKPIPDEQNEAVEILQAAFASGGKLENWKLTGLVDELVALSSDKEAGFTFSLGGVEDESVAVQDPGIVDILQRMVGQRAALFVSGTNGCGRGSTLPKQIADFRTQVKNDDRVRNIVELFG